MHRIAAATALVLAAGMPAGAAAAEFAARPPGPSLEISQPATTRSAKVLSLLLILESLRQAPVALDGQKV